MSDSRGADPEVAYALWRLGYKREAVTALRKRWENRKEDDREDAMLFVMADIGPDAVEMVPLLKKALRDVPDDWRTRYRRACVALALWRIQKPMEAGALVADPRQEALNVLLDLLRDNHIEAMEAVGQIGPEARAAIHHSSRRRNTNGGTPAPTPPALSDGSASAAKRQSPLSKRR